MKKFILHLVLIAGIIGILVLLMAYPFLPGEYDRLALALSTMVQVFGIFGLLLVPVGLIWLIYEVRKVMRRRQNLPSKVLRFYFAIAALIVASLVLLVVTFLSFALAAPSFGLLGFALWIFLAWKIVGRLRESKNAEAEEFNPVPFYLISIPIAVVIFQLVIAAPLTEFSRNQAIAMSAEIIGDIEAYHTANGSYPSSLLAVWKDYSPSVVGIEQYHYSPNEEAYNLYFEQPRFLLDNLGAREFVVYNPLDEQYMISHASWNLILSPQEVQANQGWFEVNNAASPHWKYYWFD